MQEQATGQSTAAAGTTVDPVLVLQAIRKSPGKTQTLISSVLDAAGRPYVPIPSETETRFRTDSSGTGGSGGRAQAPLVAVARRRAPRLPVRQSRTTRPRPTTEKS